MIRLFNEDCMEAMKEMPDKAYELAIVDPPYGLGDRLSDGGGVKKHSYGCFIQKIFKVGC